jgi:hypothetical protein
MKIVINAMKEKAVDKMTISGKKIPGRIKDVNKYPPDNKMTYKDKSCIRYLKTLLKKIIFNKLNRIKNQVSGTMVT